MTALIQSGRVAQVLRGLIGMGAAGGAQQQQVTAAVAAVLAAGRVPLPDRQADVKAKADDRRLAIELGGHKLERQVQRCTSPLPDAAVLCASRCLSVGCLHEQGPWLHNRRPTAGIAWPSPTRPDGNSI